MKQDPKYWLCYVSGTRCTGPAQVVLNPEKGPNESFRWIAASKEIDQADTVTFARFDEVGDKPGLYKSKPGGSVFFITTNLSAAENFVAGARAARATAAHYLSYDAGPVVTLRAKPAKAELPTPQTKGFTDADESDTDRDDDA